jgi:hypothetical protein
MVYCLNTPYEQANTMQTVSKEFISNWLKASVIELLDIPDHKQVIITAPHSLRWIPFLKSNIGPAGHYSYSGSKVSTAEFRRAVITKLKEARKNFTYK